ncbi:MAG: 7-carboxy-7-deazaguanine synthase QueE [Roseburia sp.]|nr:7-carboxy-7-deazaguanine synthase QueE [Roseburia sp.]
MKVNEIFYSLQGEGHFTGTAAVFIRLSGCNLNCDFCDTNHRPYHEMTEDEIVDAVNDYPAAHVVITGGEPTLQLTETLVRKLHRAHKFVQIETNGTRRLSHELNETLDWVTVSPKNGAIPVIQRIDELKVVFDMNHPEHIAALESLETDVPESYYLQPCDRCDVQYNADNRESCITYILENPKWKLSLQTHKMLGLR